MKILMYSTRSYDKISFRAALENYPGIKIDFLEAALNKQTAESAKGYDAVCVFVNDVVDREVIEALKKFGTKMILARCVGTNNIDIESATTYGIKVKNVPAYSPESVAEHALALLMSVNRRIHKAYGRVRDNNFSLTGLSGYCLHGKTVGIIGLGRIGQAFARICYGLGMNVIGYDTAITDKFAYITMPNDTGTAFKVPLVDLDSLYKTSDVISIHVPLMKKTKHLINADAMAKMKDDVILINVSRGGLIDTEALVDYNKKGKFFGIGLDVYEGEDENAFTNHEDDILMNNKYLPELLSCPNVIVTSHQAFLTDIALQQIAVTTLDNCVNE